jgi:hypothetical protein
MRPQALVEDVLRMAALSLLEHQEMGQSGRVYFERHFAPNRLANELVKYFKEVSLGL